MQKIFDYIKNEIVLVISLILAIISCFFVTPSIHYIDYIDFKVLICLFCLMLIVSGFIKLNVLDIVAQKLLSKANSLRAIYIIIVILTFISAMVITNDVALITFVPLTLTILRMCEKTKYSIMFIVLQTIAANLGSSLTPVGNPQNLYLFSFYNISTLDFFSATLPIVILSGMLLFLCVILVKKESLKIEVVKTIEIQSKFISIMYLVLFVITVLSVFNIVSHTLVLIIVIISILLLDKTLFKEVDYSLLLTFVGFFIFVGNISNIDSIKVFFADILTKREFLVSIALSQVISNVPAAMLLSNFTNNAREVLLGVNIGGLGTLIASLASVISFKIYCKEKSANKGKYMISFTTYNLIFLIVLIIFSNIII